MLLRTPRSFLYGIWVIPCAVIGVALISYSLFAITAHVKAEQARIDEEHRLHPVIANNSGKAVFYVELMWDGFGARTFSYDMFHPTPPTPERVAVAIESMQQTPKWHSGLTLSVEWRRQTRGTTFTEDEFYSLKGGTKFQAKVPVPPYSGIKDKTMLIIFMPSDMVYIRIVDSEILENALRQPIDPQLAHFLQRCSYEKALAWVDAWKNAPG